MVNNGRPSQSLSSQVGPHKYDVRGGARRPRYDVRGGARYGSFLFSEAIWQPLIGLILIKLCPRMWMASKLAGKLYHVE